MSRGGAKLFRDPWERWPYAVLFAGIALTTLGSAYYHLSPDNATLVWDRLPMTFGFMGLLTALLGERVGLRVGQRLLDPWAWEFVALAAARGYETRTGLEDTLMLPDGSIAANNAALVAAATRMVATVVVP